MSADLFVKICGITRLEDAKLVARLGGNAIGFIFYPASKRFIKPEIAAPIADAAHVDCISTVGVFVNPSLAELEETVNRVALDYLQLHGNETPSFIEEVRDTFPDHQIIKAIRLGKPEANSDYLVDFELLDHATTSEWGGTGQTVAWDAARVRVNANRRKVLLAGGITPDNIREAIAAVSPAGIDLSSGVESSPGIKSEAKLVKLFENLGRGSR